MSCLLFADDVALITKTGVGLRSLLDCVKRGFDKLKLTIGYDKSQILSPDDIEWKLEDTKTSTEKSLQQVALYKYLGVDTYNSMYRTGIEKQKRSVVAAQRYKGCCMHVSRMGPDVVDVVQCTWLNVALPAILNGCEFIPFCETRILELERIQSQIAKFALGLPSSSPNICAQTELGWKPVRQLLYEKQFKFYFQIFSLMNSDGLTKP